VVVPAIKHRHDRSPDKEMKASFGLFQCCRLKPKGSTGPKEGNGRSMESQFLIDVSRGNKSCLE